MTSRSILLISSAISLVCIAIGYAFSYTYDFGICYSNDITLAFDVTCSQFFRAIGNPLYIGSAGLSIIFLLLAVFPYATRAWGYFALWYVPFATELFIFYRDPHSGDFWSPSAEWVFLRLSAIYVVISAIIVITSTVRRRMGYVSVYEPWSKKKKVIFWSTWAVYVAIIYFPHVYSGLRYLLG